MNQVFDFLGQQLAIGDRVIFFLEGRTDVGTIIRMSVSAKSLAIKTSNDKPEYYSPANVIKFTEDIEKLLVIKELKQ